MTTGVFDNGGRRAGDAAELWRTDSDTLREVVVDRAAMGDRLGAYPSVERVWALSLLGRGEQAIAEGHLLLAGSKDRFRPLLVLAHARWYQYHWREAALLQEEALRLSGSSTREALVRYEIGRRFLDERRYRDAAAELDWAHDLYRTAGQERLARVCREGLERTREMLTAAETAWSDSRRAGGGSPDRAGRPWQKRSGQPSAGSGEPSDGDDLQRFPFRLADVC